MEVSTHGEGMMNKKLKLILLSFIPLPYVLVSAIITAVYSFVEVIADYIDCVAQKINEVSEDE